MPLQFFGKFASFSSKLYENTTNYNRLPSQILSFQCIAHSDFESIWGHSFENLIRLDKSDVPNFGTKPLSSENVFRYEKFFKKLTQLLEQYIRISSKDKGFSLLYKIEKHF